MTSHRWCLQAGKSDLGDDGENAASLSLPSAASPPLVPPPADLPPRVTLTRQLAGEEGGAGRPPPPLLPYQNGHHLFPMPAMQDTPPFGECVAATTLVHPVTNQDQVVQAAWGVKRPT